jgi:hypothetical protein
MHWRAERAAKQRAEPYVNEGIKVYIKVRNTM